MNIRDIAKLAGVSSATVSRVINHSGYVKEETRQKVEQAIQGNHYVPNAAARSLSTQNSSSIGVIIPDITNEFFPNIFVGINDVAQKNQLNVLFFDTGESVEREHRYLQSVQSQQMKGLIITPVSGNDLVTQRELHHLEEAGIPVVLVDRNTSGDDLSGVFVDNHQASYEGVKTLAQAGHQKIAIITGPPTSLPGKERFEGYCQALKDCNLPYREEFVVSGKFRIQEAYEQTKALMELKDRPTAIFSSNNLMTLGCLKYLTEKKWKIGMNISVLGFDDINSLNIIDYPLSVITRDERLQGREAMELLLNQLQLKEDGKVWDQERKVVRIPYKIILRGSEQYQWK